MIHHIYSSLPTFKPFKLQSGLNVLVAKKEKGATDKQTRNRSGKTSLVEIIHFLMGAEAAPDSLFRSEVLKKETFGIEFDLGGERLCVERSGKKFSEIVIKCNGLEERTTNTEWSKTLGERMFGLHQIPKGEGRRPKFRSLFSYFARRQLSGAFMTPEKQANMQQIGDFQIAILFLLGLDWKIASDWQIVREREKTLAELRKAAGAGVFGSVVGKTADLRTQLAVKEEKVDALKSQLKSFRVLPQYAEFEEEADRITRKINEYSNQNVIDIAAISNLKRAIDAEAPPPLGDFERVYAEAGIILPQLVVRRYDEVRSFHESIIKNRRNYLSEEIVAAEQRVSKREEEKQKLDQRRAIVMDLLHSHGALDQFSRLQSEATILEVEVESLRQRFAAAEQLEGTKSELEIERRRLEQRLRRNFSEQSSRLSSAILAFETISRKLYESAGSMTVEDTPNGPVFGFPMQGSRSKGIKNMQIFCFDMMLMHLWVKSPGFLIHDSHLFDGVDGRQLISALKVGAETAHELGFQYIVTMNEDDAFKETTGGFNLSDYVNETVLTDANEDGGLFGIRF